MLNNIKLICIIGVDGVGKTTQAKKLVTTLSNKNIKCSYLWFRFNHFISLPLLAYCRLTGLTHYDTNNNVVIGKHEFYKSRLIRFLYPWTSLLDVKLAFFLKILLPLKFEKTVFICDRFILDTLVDLMIDLNDFSLPEKRVGKLLLSSIPIYCKTILLDAEISMIRRRRSDLVLDASLESRRKAYLTLSHYSHLITINALDNIENVQRTIQHHL